MNVGITMSPPRETVPMMAAEDAQTNTAARYEVRSPATADTPAWTHRAALEIVRKVALLIPGHWVSLWQRRRTGDTVRHYRAERARCKACGGEGVAHHAPCSVPECDHEEQCFRCLGYGRRVVRAKEEAKS